MTQQIMMIGPALAVVSDRFDAIANTPLEPEDHKCPTKLSRSPATRPRSSECHYENNYGGAVQRLNAITKQLAELDFASAPIFVINGLKREELSR
jgi:superoxide dismutase, Fe-Mn family